VGWKSVAALILLVVGAAVAAPPATLIGTWTGASRCVDQVKRPACKHETIVYRFVPHGTHRAMLYADKIIAGKREAMGALDMQLTDGDRTASAHFTRGRTSGTWRYTMTSDDALTGTLRIDPDDELGRNVDAHRVSDDKVPPAPPMSDYAE
jgi:hypothetical protein